MPNKVSIENNLKAVFNGLEKDAQKAMQLSVFRVHKELTEVLSGNRSGFEYPVPGTGKVVNAEKEVNGRTFHYRKLQGARYYRASAPGEPPASRLGQLRTSYQHLIKGTGFNSVGYVGSPLDYSHYLEKGTSNIYPRPHLSVAFRNSKDDVERYFKSEMSK